MLSKAAAMLINCSHCQTSLDISPELYGSVVQCPVCNGKLRIEAPEETTSTGKTKPKREGWQESDQANVDALKAFLFGLTATLLFLGIMFPLRGSIGAIFLDRGWVNWAETLLFFWGSSILILKHIQNQRQLKAVLLNLFPSRLGDEINSANVAAFIDNVYKTPVALRDSIMVNRIRKALELFETRNSNSETSAFLTAQSEMDANRSSGSYALVKVFLWAIPILGFIGTVQGLSTAVGSLNMGDSADPEALKASLNSLTGGLGVAFDTTLLGLILSMILSFPLAAVQKKEDEMLTLVDVFCTEKLLPRLNDTGHARHPDGLLEQAETLPEMVNTLAKAHATFIDNLNASTRQVQETAEQAGRQAAENQRLASEFQKRINQDLESAAAQLEETRKEMSKAFCADTERLGKAASDLLATSQNELNTTFRNIAEGIDRLNAGLKKLGEEQLPGGKKGLFGRLFGS